MIQKFSEVEAKLDSMVKKYDYYSIYARDGRDIAPEVREETSAKSDKGIVNYKDSILFTKRAEDYVKYRKMDMELDAERVDPNKADSPALCDVNFKYETIGSDETGTGEIFKPMVVTAVYLENAAQVESCIKLGITDSKNLKNNPNRVYEIAESVTEISQKDWEKIKDQKLIVSDFYAIRIVTNKELNEACEAGTKPGEEVDIDGAKELLLKKAHMEALSALYERHGKAAVVIDDFTEEMKRKKKDSDLMHKDFRGMLEQSMPGADIYLTTKGDAKVISVALASMISYYISHLGHVEAKEKFISLCGDENCKFPAGANLNEPVTQKENKTKFTDCIKNISTDNFKKYMDTYAKRYYNNVIELMKIY